MRLTSDAAFSVTVMAIRKTSLCHVRVSRTSVQSTDLLYYSGTASGRASRLTKLISRRPDERRIEKSTAGLKIDGTLPGIALAVLCHEASRRFNRSYAHYVVAAIDVEDVAGNPRGKR